jgi:hypothetical protein
MPEGKISVTPNDAAFFHEKTYTIAYVVSEQGGDHCAIIDSVLDYNLESGRISTVPALARARPGTTRGSNPGNLGLAASEGSD